MRSERNDKTYGHPDVCTSAGEEWGGHWVRFYCLPKPLYHDLDLILRLALVLTLFWDQANSVSVTSWASLTLLLSETKPSLPDLSGSAHLWLINSPNNSKLSMDALYWFYIVCITASCAGINLDLVPTRAVLTKWYISSRTWFCFLSAVP